MLVSVSPVSPKKKIIYLGALLIGLILPTGIIYLGDLLDNKVHGKKDIEKLGLPLLGEIPKNDTGKDIVIGQGERTGIAEAFRLLRTNINFMLDQNKPGGKLIFVTSTVAKEGKSFNSVNLAHTFALSGKKTVLIGLDLRAPKLMEYMAVNLSKGVTHYLSDSNLSIENICHTSPNIENLWLIPSGIIPPNPAELLMRERLQDLLDQLKERFDYVIVDTAPVGLVTDTLLIAPKADLFVYVVRANMLDTRMLHIPQNLYNEQKLKNMAMLINGTELGGKGYGYGYGYGYGAYGESYHDEVKPKTSWEKIVGKFKKSS